MNILSGRYSSKIQRKTGGVADLVTMHGQEPREGESIKRCVCEVIFPRTHSPGKRVIDPDKPIIVLGTSSSEFHGSWTSR